jgi:hypothetical protein
MSPKLFDTYKEKFAQAKTVDTELSQVDVTYKVSGKVSTEGVAKSERQIKDLEEYIAHLLKYKKPIRDLCELESPAKKPKGSSDFE